MGTLDIINTHGELIIAKLKRGEQLTKAEQNILEIYSSLHGKKAGNAGKRQDQYAPKKQRIRK